MWIAGRYVYVLGYWSGGRYLKAIAISKSSIDRQPVPLYLFCVSTDLAKKRLYGVFALLGLLALMICALINALDRIGIVDI